MEQGRGWWSWGKGDGTREEAMHVGRGRGERMGKGNWVSDGVGKSSGGGEGAVE